MLCRRLLARRRAASPSAVSLASHPCSARTKGTVGFQDRSAASCRRKDGINSALRTVNRHGVPHLRMEAGHALTKKLPEPYQDEEAIKAELRVLAEQTRKL